MTHHPDALTELEAALEGLSTAMATGKADAVLAAEEPLAAAVCRVVGLTRSSHAASPTLRSRIRAARIALIKCQLLGRASEALEQAMVPNSAYSAAGMGRPVAPRSTMESRS